MSGELKKAMNGKRKTGNRKKLNAASERDSFPRRISISSVLCCKDSCTLFDAFHYNFETEQNEMK